MLPPILPRPTIPSCTTGSPLSWCDALARPSSMVLRRACEAWGEEGHSLARETHRQNQVAVAAWTLWGPRRLVAAGRLLDAGEHRRLERADEVHPRSLGVHGGQAV